MRKQLPKTIYDLMKINPRIFVILGDIGVYSFSKISTEFPERILNIGIMEQTMIGVASGLSIGGYLPIVHTIAPFLVERAYEQLKLDFGYQSLDGIFVSVGGSYEYSYLGGTHHSPADVNLISNIPDFMVLVPGTSSELDTLIHNSIKIPRPKYFRLSEFENSNSYPVNLGELFMIQKGNLASVIVVGTMLKNIMPEISNYDVNVFYCTTVVPFNTKKLLEFNNGRLVIIEPYFSGAILNQIIDFIGHTKVLSIGVPKKFIHFLGSNNDIEIFLELDKHKIFKKIGDFIND